MVLFQARETTLSDWANFTKPVCGLRAQPELNRKSPVPQILDFSLTWLESGKQSKQGEEGLGKWGAEEGQKLPTFWQNCFQPLPPKRGLLPYGASNVCLLCLCGYLLLWRVCAVFSGTLSLSGSRMECLPTATSTYLAVELVSDPGFVRMLTLQHCTRSMWWWNWN